MATFAVMIWNSKRSQPRHYPPLLIAVSILNYGMAGEITSYSM